MKLLEIINIHADEFEGKKDDFPVLDDRDPADVALYKKAKPLPGGSHYTWNLRKNGFQTYVYIFDPEMPDNLKDEGEFPLIGNLSLEKTNNLNSVDSIAVLPEYRGKKIGLALYGLVLDVLRLPLQSGDMQTPNGKKMWANIASVPGVQISALITTKVAFFREKNFTPTGLKEWEKIVQDLGVSDKALAEFVKQIGGHKTNIGRNMNEIPVTFKNGEASNPYVNLYGTYATTLVARKPA